MSTGLSDCEKRQRLAAADPKALGKTGPPKVVRPFVVRPTIARQLLGNIGSAKLWELINNGQIDSYLTGRSRFITTESIERYIARNLAEARDENGRLKLYEPPPAADASSAKTQPERRRTNTQEAIRVA
jgi:hypothetical protein